MKKSSRFRLNGEIIESIIFTILGLFIMISALNMNTYGSWALAPGLFPLIISILLLLLSLSLFLQGVKKNKKETEGTGEKKKEKTEEDKINWIGVLFVFGFSLLYCFTLPIIHFIPASLIYLAVMMFFLKEKRWWLVGIITAATTFGLYYFFGILLKVILP
jgi:hypothetical protein